MGATIDISNVHEFSGERWGSSYVRKTYRDDELVYRLSTATKVESIHQVCLDICHKYDFQFYTAFTRLMRLEGNPISIILRECNNEWTDFYYKNNLLSQDPSIRIAFKQVTPFTFSLDIYEKLNRRYSFASQETNMLSWANEFGLRRSFNLPFRGSSGDFGVIRFINIPENTKPNTYRKLTATENSALFSLSAHIYEAFIRINQLDTQDTILSCREQDVLLWLANGINPAGIGDRLNISENTVNKHLKNIRDKLKVRNSSHAIAKAISKGIIHL